MIFFHFPDLLSKYKYLYISVIFNLLLKKLIIFVSVYFWSARVNYIKIEKKRTVIFMYVIRAISHSTVSNLGIFRFITIIWKRKNCTWEYTGHDYKWKVAFISNLNTETEVKGLTSLLMYTEKIHAHVSFFYLNIENKKSTKSDLQCELLIIFASLNRRIFSDLYEWYWITIFIFLHRSNINMYIILTHS